MSRKTSRKRSDYPVALTAGGKSLLGLIVFVGAVASPYNAPVFIVLSCFISLLLLNVPYAWLAIRGIAVVREHVSHVREGDKMLVRLHVRCRHRGARVLLHLRDAGPGGIDTPLLQVAALEGGETRTLSYTCIASRRGVYTFERCTILSAAPFGLVRASVPVGAHSDLVVYPIFYELSRTAIPMHTTHSGMSGMPASRPGEGPSFFGLRQYRDGDPVRKIHWPTTVRTGKVMVKEFEEDMHSAVALILDTSRRSVRYASPDSNLEVAVRVAASLANHALVQGHPTLLVTCDTETGQLRSASATGNLTPILDGLARVGPTPMPATELLQHSASEAAGYANWVVISLANDRGFMEELLRQRSQGRDILLIVVDADDTEPRPPANGWLPEMVELLEHAGVAAIFMSPMDDVQATLSGRLPAARAAASSAAMAHRAYRTVGPEVLG